MSRAVQLRSRVAFDVAEFGVLEVSEGGLGNSGNLVQKRFNVGQVEPENVGEPGQRREQILSLSLLE